MGDHPIFISLPYLSFDLRLKNDRKLPFAHPDRELRTMRNFTSIRVGNEKNLKNAFDEHEVACMYLGPSF
jgi:hypothetical protein